MMNTKVKLDRLEHYIPSPSVHGLLYVDENEEKMVRDRLDCTLYHNCVRNAVCTFLSASGGSVCSAH